MLRRTMVSTALLAGLAAAGLAAQDGPAPTRLYVALFDVPYPEIGAWVAAHEEYAAPILTELVEEGMIVGFGIRIHNTGGEYSVREVYAGNADTNYHEFWGTYLSRFGERHPDVLARTMGMIRQHDDEIWILEEVQAPNGVGSRYAYEAKFQIDFSDLEAWGEIWRNELFPVADRLIEEGLVRGYVVNGHDTGGPYNWQFVWLFDDWDSMDDAAAAFFEAAPFDHPLWEMVRAHRDELWETPGG